MSEARILLLRPDKAGDAIKTLPALRALRLARPDLDIHVLSSEHNSSLFETEPGVTNHELPHQWQQWRPARLRGYLFAGGMPTSFSVAVNLLCDSFSEVDQLISLVPALRKFSIAKTDWDTHTSPDLKVVQLPDSAPAGRDETRNISDILSSAFECDVAAFLEKTNGAPVLTLEDRTEAEKLLPVTDQRRIGICPFAGTVQRSHSLKRWSKLLHKLSTKADSIEWVVYCPEQQREAAMALLPERSNARFHIVSPPRFRVLAACFEKMDAVVAVDSGPLHLAQAMQIPVLGFLSGGDSARWFAKPNPQDRLLRRGLLSRFPSYLEMWWALKRWVSPLPHRS
jgi:hypothetical protein